MTARDKRESSVVTAPEMRALRAWRARVTGSDLEWADALDGWQPIPTESVRRGESEGVSCRLI